MAPALQSRAAGVFLIPQNSFERVLRCAEPSSIRTLKPKLERGTQDIAPVATGFSLRSSDDHRPIALFGGLRIARVILNPALRGMKNLDLSID